MSEFLQRLEDEIRLRELFLRGQKILVAVSGGVDSMVLLHALHTLASKNRWQFSVAHFNHQLRGRSSDADEQLVRKTAAALKFPLVVGRADVKTFARKSRLSIEMAARKLRHEFFARTAREQKIPVIALAHHADDQVELFFLRLLRGAGGEGLAGMKSRSPSPVDKTISLVRPLLGFSKTELLALAREQKIRFRDDTTNFSGDFLRNRIRNELVPLLQRKYQPGLAKSVLRLMEIVGAESESVGKTAEDWSKRRWPDFDNLAIAVQRRILQSQLLAHGLMVDFELVESLRQSAGVLVSINRNLAVARTAAGKLFLKRQRPVEFNANKLAVNLADRAGEATFEAARVSWSFDAKKHFRRPPKATCCEFFDAEKVGRKITLRHWRPGDRLQPIGLNSTAKLQDLLTNAKIPREQRHQLIVAATSAGKIFWVEGLRMADDFKLTPETKRRLIWRWQRQRWKSKNCPVGN